MLLPKELLPNHPLPLLQIQAAEFALDLQCPLGCFLLGLLYRMRCSKDGSKPTQITRVVQMFKTLPFTKPPKCAKSLLAAEDFFLACSWLPSLSESKMLANLRPTPLQESTLRLLNAALGVGEAYANCRRVDC